MTLTAAAHCLHRGCPWTASGSWAEADRAAERHSAAGHPTATIITAERKQP
jgi:hypothetical protein